MSGDHVFGTEDADAVYRLASQTQVRLGEQVRHALEVIEEALEKYSLASTSLSFNGGKDCTVLLHIFAAATHRLHAKRKGSANGKDPELLRSIYVRSESPFPQVEEFIQRSAIRYGLDLVRIQANMRDALAQYRSDCPDIQAVIIGTRRSDPHCENLQAMQETDAGWPRYMRVHPILDWSYADVWAFLRNTASFGPDGIPYCSLYDYGHLHLSRLDARHLSQSRIENVVGAFDVASRLEARIRDVRARRARMQEEAAGRMRNCDIITRL